VSAAVATAVAEAALAEGLAQVELTDPAAQVRDAMWFPDYPDVLPI
jgi:malate dehydrogenase (oxaloacetate-decarboxylating)